MSLEPTAERTSTDTPPGGVHPVRERVESQWPKSLLGIVLVVAVLGVVMLLGDPRDSSAGGLERIVGTTAAVAGEDLEVVAEFEFPEHHVQFLEGPGVPRLIAVHDANGRALGVYERLDRAVRSYPAIDSPELAREFAVRSRIPASR